MLSENIRFGKEASTLHEDYSRKYNLTLFILQTTNSSFRKVKTFHSQSKLTDFYFAKYRSEKEISFYSISNSQNETHVRFSYIKNHSQMTLKRPYKQNYSILSFHKALIDILFIKLARF